MKAGSCLHGLVQFILYASIASTNIESIFSLFSHNHLPSLFWKYFIFNLSHDFKNHIIMTVKMTSTNGSTTNLNSETIDTFRSSLRGNIVTPESLDYDTARKIWNGMVDERPAIIVKCSGTADVINAVKFANEHQLLVAVKGAGHN